MARLSRDDQHRQVAVQLNFLESFHHLESIHALHLKIKQDQVIAVLKVKRTNSARVHRGCNGIITGPAQHPLEQLDINFPIVNDQDLTVKNVR